jgi:hypothetical protein
MVGLREALLEFVSRKKSLITNSRQGRIGLGNYGCKETERGMPIRLSKRGPANTLHSINIEVYKCGRRVSGRSAQSRALVVMNHYE